MSTGSPVPFMQLERPLTCGDDLATELAVFDLELHLAALGIPEVLTGAERPLDTR